MIHIFKRVQLVSLVQLDGMGCLVDLDYRDHQDLLANQGKMEIKARLDHRERKASKETRVRWVLLDLLVAEVLPVTKELLEHQVIKESEGKWADKEQKVKTDLPDLLDLTVLQVLKEYLDLLV